MDQVDVQIDPPEEGRDSGQVEGACPQGDTPLTLSLSLQHVNAHPLGRHFAIST